MVRKLPISEDIRAALEMKFAPQHLEIRDDSERHRGHAGWREGGETHFHVTMTSDRLEGLSRIERHRAVHTALGPDLVSRIHALSLKLDA
jgi:BolA protein